MVKADQITNANPSNRKICIIDSGYYMGHEDLQDTSVTASPDKSTGNPYADAFGHGTHVAGTIAALANRVGVVGVNSGGVLNLHIVKVFGDDGIWAYSSSLIAALDECRQANANVVSMSLGGDMPSRVENNAFANAYAAGVLSVAAAGNGGDRRTSYPAGYESVVSVAASTATRSLRPSRNRTEMSNSPHRVLPCCLRYHSWTPTLSRPVISTYSGTWIENAARTPGVTAVLTDGGLCEATNSGWSGQVVLCERGSISFYDKVHNIESSGGVAAVIFNNVDGGFLGTLGDGNSSSIAAIGLSRADGLALKRVASGKTPPWSALLTNPQAGMRRGMGPRWRRHTYPAWQH